MSKSLEAALDEGLNRIDARFAGEETEGDLDSFLAQHPDRADEVRPLLELAAELIALREDVPPPPGGLKAGRQRLLQEAARLNIAESDRRVRRRVTVWGGVQALMRRSAIVVTLASILLVVLLGRGTLAASANSLPGDALYPVKRMAEEFQLVFTVNPEAKAQLQQQLDERRREEARAIVTTHRVADLSFRGTVERVSPDQWTVGGVVVLVSSDTAMEGELDLGSRVRVDARSMSDGTLRAMRIAVEPEPLAAAPAPSDTPESTRAAVPTSEPPTEVPTIPQSKPTTLPVEVIPSATPSSMPTPLPTATATSTETRVPPTPLPPREVKVRVKGRIDAMSAEAWTVDGVQVLIRPGTAIDESQAPAAVGATATVLAIRNEDESLVAVEIKVEAAASIPEQPFEFQGLIESWTEERWFVGGYDLIVNPYTLVEGNPQKGLLAEIKAVRLSDGTILAKQIIIRLPTEEVQFEGVIQSMSVGEWVVEGVVVRFDAGTVVEGSPEVGAQVEVQGLLLADGAVLGRRIVVQAVPPPVGPAPELGPGQ
jgi:hypothetical protein